MADSVQVAAFEGGELKLLSEDIDSPETVLALPLSRLIVRMLRVPPEGREDPSAFATPVLQAMSPYPDEPLKVSHEVVCEKGRDLVVIAAALPESAAEDIAEALDANKLNVTRVDALILGELRRFWNGINTSDGARRLIKVKSADCTTLLVLDGDMPASIRSVFDGAEMKREEMLSLLEAEDFGGPKELKETLEFESDLKVALEGVAARSLEAGTLNALPESWGEVLAETRFKAKLVQRLSIAGGIWAFIMVVLFGVPVVFGMLANHQKELCKEHRHQYQTVKDIKDQVEIFRKYSDHSRGGLEILKAVSDRSAGINIELDSWQFERGKYVLISGEGEDTSSVLNFQDQLKKAAFNITDESGEIVGSEPVFPVVERKSLTARRGRQHFSFELGFVAPEEETE